jgi:aspartyl-tRNA(Asn)/glutamyl-tRNA(Gln) amidotransferase subunit A
MEPCGSLAELRSALDGGRTSAAQLVEQSLARATALDPTLRAFVRLRADAARAEARESDARRARGERRSALEGIPIAIKDNLVRRGEPATCASRILQGFVSPYDATAVEKLAAAGAIAIGATNLDEFAMGSSTENSAFGPSRNPWNPARTPGGS